MGTHSAKLCRRLGDSTGAGVRPSIDRTREVCDVRLSVMKHVRSVHIISKKLCGRFQQSSR